jgi:adenylate cyclase
MSLFNELKKRNVLRVTIAYLAASWLLIQIVETLFPVFGLPDERVRLFVILLSIGFPITVLFSWLYELTPDGLKLEKDVDRSRMLDHHAGKKLDRVIIVVLTLALGYFTVDKFVLDPARDVEREQAAVEIARSNAFIESFGEKSIAVLPFMNMSDDSSNEYFSDGISEDLLNLLAKIKELRVISRSSSFSFKGKDIALPEVAAELNVSYVLEGSVRRDGNQVRITAQLIDARADSQLWSESYDRPLDDIFAVQDEIAAAIGEALKTQLSLDIGASGVMASSSTKATNISAYDAYLQGRELIVKRKNFRQAIDHLTRSLRLDDNYAPAHAQLAIAILLRWVTGQYTEDDARRMAERHLDQAETLEPGLPLVQAGRALLAWRNHDPESAVKYASAALEGNPSDVDAMNWLQLSLGRLGRYDEAEEVLQRMLEVDPLSIPGRENYIELLTESGRCEEAQELADQLLDLRPNDGYLHRTLIALFCKGDVAEALAWGLKLPSDFGLASWAFVFVGEYDEARRVAANREMWIDFLEGNTEKAIESTLRNLELRPNEIFSLDEAAGALYMAGRYEEALPLFEHLLELAPEGRPIAGIMELHTMMRFAVARRLTGDEEGAAALVEITRRDHDAQRANGRRSADLYLVETRIAAFDRDHERAIEALRLSIQNGLRQLEFLDELGFERMADDPQFIEVRSELSSIIDSEHKKVLQLICFNNPVPDDWQPLPETCEGVVEQPVLLSAE